MVNNRYLSNKKEKEKKKGEREGEVARSITDTSSGTDEQRTEALYQVSQYQGTTEREGRGERERESINKNRRQKKQDERRIGIEIKKNEQ